MWIYDGEQWIEEGASENETKSETRMPQFDQFYPELQIVEVVPLPKPNYIGPITLP